MTHAPNRVAIADAIGRTGIWAIGAYVAVLPFDHLAALRTLTLGTAFACALVLWWRTPDRRLPLWPSFLVWLIAALASLGWSVDPAESLEATWRDVGKTFLVFAAAYVLARRAAGLREIGAMTSLGAIVLSALALPQYLRSMAWPTGGIVPYLGDYATTASTVLPLLAAIALLDDAGRGLAMRRALYAVAAVGLLAGGFATHSRAFWLALLASAVVGYGVLLLRRQVRHPRLGIATLAALLAAAALALSFSAALRSKPVGYLDDRVMIYSRTLDKVLANPWRGTGYGHETDAAWYQRAVPELPITHPHNLLLSYADQMGVWGLVVLLVIFGALLRGAIAGSGAGGRACAVFGACALGSIVAVFLANNLNMFFIRQHLWLFYAHMGLYLGWIEARRLESAARSAAGQEEPTP